MNMWCQDRQQSVAAAGSGFPASRDAYDHGYNREASRPTQNASNKVVNFEVSVELSDTGEADVRNVQLKAVRGQESSQSAQHQMDPSFPHFSPLRGPPGYAHQVAL